jgi:hypothetical protein
VHDLLNIFEPLIAVLQLNVSYTYNKPQKFFVQLLGFITDVRASATNFCVYLMCVFHGSIKRGRCCYGGASPKLGQFILRGHRVHRRSHHRCGGCKPDRQ